MLVQYQKNDEYFTPSYAVYPIMKRLKQAQQYGVLLTRKRASMSGYFPNTVFPSFSGISRQGRIFFRLPYRTAIILSATRHTA